MNLGFLEILVQLPLHTQAGLTPPVTMLCCPVPTETYVPLLTFALTLSYPP